MDATAFSGCIPGFGGGSRRDVFDGNGSEGVGFYLTVRTKGGVIIAKE